MSLIRSLRQQGETLGPPLEFLIACGDTIPSSSFYFFQLFDKGLNIGLGLFVR
jgi:hypothetical protein